MTIHKKGVEGERRGYWVRVRDWWRGRDADEPPASMRKLPAGWDQESAVGE